MYQNYYRMHRTRLLLKKKNLFPFLPSTIGGLSKYHLPKNWTTWKTEPAKEIRKGVGWVRVGGEGTAMASPHRGKVGFSSRSHGEVGFIHRAVGSVGFVPADVGGKFVPLWQICSLILSGSYPSTKIKTIFFSPPFFFFFHFWALKNYY